MKQLEAQLGGDFGDHSEEDEEDDLSDEADDLDLEAPQADAEDLELDPDLEQALMDDLYCVACNKAFKSSKAFSNHEKSKKHLQNVELLKEEIGEEEEED